jgi:hypothetical protein
MAAISQRGGIQEKTIKEIFPSSLFNKGEGSKKSGICLLAIKKDVPKQKILPGRQGKRGNAKFIGKAGGKAKKISFQKEERFSLKQRFSPLSSLLYKAAKIRPLKIKKISEFFNKNGKKKKGFLGIRPVRFVLRLFNKTNPVKFISQLFNRTNLLRKAKSGYSAISEKKYLNRRTNPRLEKYKKKAIPLDVKKILILIFVLIIVLSLGFLIFKGQGQKENDIKALLAGIKEKTNQADNFLVFGDKEKANSLLESAWQEILPLSEEKSPFKADVLSLRQSIEKKLNKLNNLEIIENPQIAGKTAPGLFSSSPSSSLVKPPPFKFNFDISSSYFLNLYFLDGKTCQIIKYPYLPGEKWGPPKIWKKPDNNCSGLKSAPPPSCCSAKSMAIDGSVWILNKDNSISRYYIGSYKETINLNVFPVPKDITKIKTAADIPYLYFLEPGQKRIIITDKKGKIIKQFQSEKFDNLKDFAFSKDGKIIYILNGTSIYKIEF